MGSAPPWTIARRSRPHFSAWRLFRLRHASQLLPWLRETRRLRPDVALDFQGLLRSALIGGSVILGVLWHERRARRGALFLSTCRAGRSQCSRGRALSLAHRELRRPHHAPLRFPFRRGIHIERFDEEQPFVLLHPFARGRRKSLSDLAVEEFCHALAPIALFSSVESNGKSRPRRIASTCSITRASCN